MACAAALAACRLEQPEEEAWFSLEADASLTGYSRVTVSLHDSSGAYRATLFDDSLDSPNRLGRLSAGPYRGGPARIVIQGYEGGRVAYRETRVYDGTTQRVLAVDIVLYPAAQEPTPAGKPLPRSPVLTALAPDTVVSIGDSAVLWAEAEDADGDLSGYALDCDGDGAFEDTVALRGGRAPIQWGRRFADSGSYACQLKVWDGGNRSAAGRLRVTVERDPPTADAGGDTTVPAGGLILLHARGQDRFGPIVTREWKIGAKPFVPVSQQETVQQAPAEAGRLLCILRVTDSDGLSGLDTLVVTVIQRTDMP